jgi:hypothetical protein
MAVKSGAGASVASGAGYQARVTAYFASCALVGEPVPAFPFGTPIRIACETGEAIDDLQLYFDNGRRILAQAKRSLSFSTAPGSELYSVLAQFVLQHVATDDALDEFCLITSSSASKRVTGDMLAALNAARECSSEVFERDQPKAVVETLNALIDAVHDLLLEARPNATVKESRAILLKVRLVVIDIDPHSSLEQALVLILSAAGYSAPSELWGKLIANSLEWARNRQTIELSSLKTTYAHLKSLPPETAASIEHQILKYEFSAETVAVAREIAIGRALTDDLVPSGTVVVLELYRFDDECHSRVEFTNEHLILASNVKVELWGRFATWVGLERYVDENIDLLNCEEIIVLPINSDDDFETSLCATAHRRALQVAAARRPMFHCIHCEKPVSSSMSPFVEFGEGDGLVVGLTHRECLRLSDRILGLADSGFFRNYPELMNFDVNGWFQAAHSGHGVFKAIRASGEAVPITTWGGTPTHEARLGAYVVVSVLEDGTEELCTKRGLVQRFTRQHADEFAGTLRSHTAQAAQSGNPLCYSDQSRAFGNKSTLLKLLGGKEKLLSIVGVEVRTFDAQEAARYPNPGSWYAPLLVLRDATSLDVFALGDAVPALSDPLALGQFLANWRNAGFDLPNYEIELLLTDAEADSFFERFAGSDVGVILDPVLSEDGNANLLRGSRVYPVQQLKKRRGPNGKQDEG